MAAVGDTRAQRILLQIPDVGICRRDAQRHIRVVGQLLLLQNDGIALLQRFIGIRT
jgi:hypothetical protein